VTLVALIGVNHGGGDAMVSFFRGISWCSGWFMVVHGFILQFHVNHLNPCSHMLGFVCFFVEGGGGRVVCTWFLGSIIIVVLLVYGAA